MRTTRRSALALGAATLAGALSIATTVVPAGAAPAKKGEQVIFEEDFSEQPLGAGDWSTSDCCNGDNSWSYEISDMGTLVFQINVPTDVTSPSPTSPFKLEKKWGKKLTNQRVDVDVSLVGPAFPVVICRNTGFDSISGYGFIIDEEGRAQIGKSDGTSADILESTDAGAFDASGIGDGFVRIGGECVTKKNGDVTLTLSVNGEEILTAVDKKNGDPIKKGTIALTATEPGTVVFDNVTVTKLS